MLRSYTLRKNSVVNQPKRNKPSSTIKRDKQRLETHFNTQGKSLRNPTTCKSAPVLVVKTSCEAANQTDGVPEYSARLVSYHRRIQRWLTCMSRLILVRMMSRTLGNFKTHSPCSQRRHSWWTRLSAGSRTVRTGWIIWWVIWPVNWRRSKIFKIPERINRQRLPLSTHARKKSHNLKNRSVVWTRRTIFW